MIKPFGVNNISVTSHKSQNPALANPQLKAKPKIPTQEFQSYLSAHQYKVQTGCRRKIKKLGQSQFVV